MGLCLLLLCAASEPGRCFNVDAAALSPHVRMDDEIFRQGFMPGARLISVENDRVEVMEIMSEYLGDNFRRDIHHGLRHSQDLLRQAQVLADRLGVAATVDWKVLTAAICLHDIFASSAEEHGDDAAAFAGERFSGTGLFSPAQLAQIKEAVRFHDKKNMIVTGKGLGLETKLLYDVDNLDAFGIKGIYRYLSAYITRGRRDRRSDADILGQIKAAVLDNVTRRYENLYFDASRTLAKTEFPVTRDFFEKLRSERYDLRQLRAATGVFVLVAQSLREHPQMIAQKALAQLAANVRDEDSRYVCDYFRALHAAYAGRPAEDISLSSNIPADKNKETLAALTAIIEQAI